MIKYNTPARLDTPLEARGPKQPRPFGATDVPQRSLPCRLLLHRTALLPYFAVRRFAVRRLQRKRASRRPGGARLHAEVGELHVALGRWGGEDLRATLVCDRIDRDEHVARDVRKGSADDWMYPRPAGCNNTRASPRPQTQTQRSWRSISCTTSRID